MKYSRAAASVKNKEKHALNSFFHPQSPQDVCQSLDSFSIYAEFHLFLKTEAANKGGCGIFLPFVGKHRRLAIPSVTDWVWFCAGGLAGGGRSANWLSATNIGEKESTVSV